MLHPLVRVVRKQLAVCFFAVFILNSATAGSLNKALEVARGHINAFIALQEVSEENVNELVNKARKLGKLKYQQSEDALMGRLSLELSRLQNPSLNFMEPFIYEVVTSLSKVGTLNSVDDMQEAIDNINERLEASDDVATQKSLVNILDSLKRTLSAVRKRKPYGDDIDLYADVYDTNFEESGVSSEDIHTSHQLKKKQDQIKRSKARALAEERRKAYIESSRLGIDLGRRERNKIHPWQRKSDIVDLEDDPGTDPNPKVDLDWQPGDHKEKTAAVNDKNVTYANATLLSGLLEGIAADDSDIAKVKVSDITSCVTEYFSDGRARVRLFDMAPEIFGREEIVDKVIDILMRQKGGNPALVGGHFTGKMSIVEKLSDYIIEQSYPKEAPHKHVFGNAHIVRIDGLGFAAGKEFPAQAMENYLSSIMYMREVEHINIITYITNVEALPTPVINELERALLQNNPPQVILDTQASEFNMAFKENERMKAMFESIAVEKFTSEETIELIKNSWLEDIQDRYSINFGNSSKETNEVLEAIVEVSQKIHRHLGPIEASIRLMQDVAIYKLRLDGVNTYVDEEVVYQVAQRSLGFPVNPLDGPAMAAYLEDLKDKASKEIIGQDHLIDMTLELWAQILEDSDRGLRVGMYMGASGAGKTDLTKILAKILFGSSDRVFRMDGPAVMDKESLWTYFGATNGYRSADETAGRFIDWLDDPAGGKNGGILVIDEAERADPAFWERLMEFFDTGRIIGGDGIARYAKNLIVIMTSNKGNSVLVPRGIENWSEEKVRAHEAAFTEKQLKDLFSKGTAGENDNVFNASVLNRIDAFGLAHSINKSLLLLIASDKANKWKEKNKKKRKVNFEMSQELIEHLVLIDYRIQDGFRAPGRQLQHYLDAARDEAMKSWKTKRGDVVKFDLIVSPTEAKISISKEGEETLYIEAPQEMIDNPLKNPKEMERLSKLLDGLKSRVFGWDETLEAIYDAIFSYRTSPSRMRKRPLSLFLAGSTGTGKSELAKALGYYLFDSEDAALVMNMGLIQNESEKNNFLGSPRAHKGDEDLTELEHFVRAHEKTGGIILWDEISNMGGKDPKTKDALFKLFLGMLEEGTWTPPGRDEPYNLSKFVFIFTGNDGEKLFQNISADDMRLAVWGMNNKKEKVRAMLREAGIPASFLGRMADVILAKPLTKEVMKKVAKKLIKPVHEAFDINNVDIEIPPNQLEQFVNSFFSEDTGARSLRSMVDEKLLGWVGQVYTQAKQKLREEERMTVSLEVEDNLPKEAFAESRSFTREVKVKLIAKNSEGEVLGELTRDVSAYAPRQIRLTKKYAVGVSFHEAGHAVLSSKKLAYLTIKGADDNLGYARYEEFSSDVAPENPTKSSMLKEMAMALAGQKAMELAGFEPDSGWRSDISSVREMAYKYFVHWGDPEGKSTLSLIVDSDGRLVVNSEKISNKLQKKIKKLIKKADKLAEKTLLERWSHIELIKKELLVRGEMSGEEFYNIIEGVELEKWAKDPKTGRAVRQTEIKKKNSVPANLPPMEEVVESSISEVLAIINDRSAKGHEGCDRTLNR